MQEEKTEKFRKFSDRLRAYRSRKDLSQEALAERIGVGKGVIGNWEAGDNLPGPENRRRIREALGEKDAGYILGESESWPEKISEGLMLSEENGREVWEGIRLSAGTMDVVRKAALETGLSVSEVVEGCVLEKINEVVQRHGLRALLNNPKGWAEMVAKGGPKDEGRAVELRAPAQNKEGN